MKKVLTFLVLSSSFVSTPSFAQDIGIAFTNRGECLANLSRWNNDQRRSDRQAKKSGDASLGGDDTLYNCFGIGDYFYILPWIR